MDEYEKQMKIMEDNYDEYLWDVSLEWYLFCSKLVILEDIQSILETVTMNVKNICYRHDSRVCQIVFLYVCEWIVETNEDLPLVWIRTLNLG